MELPKISTRQLLGKIDPEKLNNFKFLTVSPDHSLVLDTKRGLEDLQLNIAGKMIFLEGP